MESVTLVVVIASGSVGVRVSVSSAEPGMQTSLHMSQSTLALRVTGVLNGRFAGGVSSMGR